MLYLTLAYRTSFSLFESFQCIFSQPFIFNIFVLLFNILIFTDNLQVDFLKKNLILCLLIMKFSLPTLTVTTDIIGFIPPILHSSCTFLCKNFLPHFIWLLTCKMFCFFHPVPVSLNFFLAFPFLF